MATWQISSDAGNNFRWNITGGDPANRAEEPHRTLIHKDNSNSRLPSMADLLFQGRSKLLENNGGRDESSPMFRTGLGKPVNVSHSSIKKALSVLGEDDSPNQGKVHSRDSGHSFSNSLFQTGSGKMVNISSAGLIKAKNLLGLEGTHNHCTSQGLKQTMKQSATDELYGWENSLHLEKKAGVGASLVPGSLVDCEIDVYSSGRDSNKAVPSIMQSEVYKSDCKPSPIKFQTAGGRSISVSSDALQRARSLLGDAEAGSFPNEGGAEDPLFSFFKDTIFDETPLDNENDPYTSFFSQDAAMSKLTSKSFLPPLGTFSNQKESSTIRESIISGSNLIKKVDTDSNVYKAFLKPNNSMPHILKPLSNGFCAPHTVVENSSETNNGSRMTLLGRSSGGPLVDISNNIGTTYNSPKHISSEKKRLRRKSSISPFKRPRNSRFSTPLTSSISFLPNDSSTLTTSEDFCCKTMVSSRYPFQFQRMTLKEFFGGPPCQHNLMTHFPDRVKWMTADNAEQYVFHDKSGSNGIGIEEFRQMLDQSGASMLHATKAWVANHYKWIVWKLACYERGYPAKATGKYLTVSNVLEELKYRYEKEINHAHRSALKRILEGDASPASMVVLCVSAIRFSPDPMLGIGLSMASHEDAKKFSDTNWTESSNVAKIELTDGWYSLDALLDAPLSKQLAARKLFVGQKLRIWGAGLCGWVGPVSPLEDSKTVNLLLHINGTYRANWADRLGFCKGLGAPLAFSCIKGTGGLIPRTLVGVVRIYPVLYRERLTDGGYVVRSERMETKMQQLYNQRAAFSNFPPNSSVISTSGRKIQLWESGTKHMNLSIGALPFTWKEMLVFSSVDQIVFNCRRSSIAEGIMSEFQKDIKCFLSENDNESEEGAKILKILETAAEPEVLMAEMSSEQLTSFASYQAKQEAIKQSDMQKKIEIALEDAGLSARAVTPFMRVRVVGLTCKKSQRKGCLRVGLITIWNPTEKQRFELVEGQAYAIAGLVPLNSDSDVLFLQARGSTTTWQPLPPSAIECFESFFTPRISVLLSNLGEVPLASEFDIAAVVVYVGEVYTSGRQKKQWVFVTDGSISELQSGESSNYLLAISFCSLVIDSDSFTPVNCNLAGSTVGFCNLLKRAKDQMNHLWVAEATENSTYSFCQNLPGFHLKEAADSAKKWAKISSSTIQKLRERVLYVIGDCEG
ncbi:hypothetical protein HHK36_010654 [Tetracentron sinense]|uniref:Tower domain-containing protein n=1 Tax=Tetracentron sinense TaxID=13715 RepID=A0A835DGI6_TETSI|nr:hypothetical protein HHK36_010654 [Tetracentron sinense]